MGSYFDRFEKQLADAAERRARRPWYRRMLEVRRTRALFFVFAALVVATPAVAAVSGWFSPGEPNATGPVSPGSLFGVVEPGHSRLLPIRVADPQGGPAWGLRVVRTTRGDTCVQIGRVEGDQLGSLGIDDAWDNDHEFHAIPTSSRSDMQCGSTDAVGHGYLNGAIDAESASVNVSGDWQSAIKVGGCQLRGFGGGSSLPYCPAGANRMIFYGLLGPEAQSITYRKPGGGLATKHTLDGVGAYLLVFPYNAKTCAEYTRSWDSSQSCNAETEGGGPSPAVPGAVVKVTYTNGRTCSLTGPSAQLIAANRAFERTAARTLLGPDYRKLERRPITAKERAEYEQLLAKFAASQHLTPTQLRRELSPIRPQCPAVGWVAPKAEKVTAAEIATPIRVRMLPAGTYGAATFRCSMLHLPEGCVDGLSAAPSRQVPVEWSFKARSAVTNSRSWYEWSVEDPGGRDCDEQGSGSSFSTYRNIPAGQTLKFSEFFEAACPGTYKITVGFMPQAPPGQPDNGGGGSPGHDSTLLVGRASFTIR
jgi:hypothetical protein